MDDPVVRIEHLSHTYMAGTPLSVQALRDVSLTVRAGTIAAVVGANGAGKSTLLHFLNALLRPLAPGRVQVLGTDTFSNDLDVGLLRRRVGLLMQFPHQQLFERFVGDDIAFGPRQAGMRGEELRACVFEAMNAVGLSPELFVDRHTFSLSGGEMRRAALAGVLAMRPELVILDEVTTGLDPRGRSQVHEILRGLRTRGITIVLVSNDMDEVMELADQVMVLERGVTVAEGIPYEVFTDGRIESWGLRQPEPLRIASELAAQGVSLPCGTTTLEDIEEALWQAWKA